MAQDGDATSLTPSFQSLEEMWNTDQRLNTHKAIRFIDHPCGIACEVFTLGTDSWRPDSSR
ncbi:hypothetical protein QJS04_geneDACA016439 [Acorus gramineus]|uniref:Uncharacterized protein n=1 Tax=Acorus gramineus TaxID=55184 RepID=A0AAV9BBJ2_ACOGR|nr:hypothetical protein QJS04_geneDACA016439 [Acorus gramineus]